MSDGGAAKRGGLFGPFWLAGLGAALVAVAIAGFAPQALTYADQGVIRPVELHVHAALMGLLLVGFIAQAALAGRGDVALHRRLGWFVAAIGAAAYVSMLVVIASSMRREDPSVLPWLPSVWTLGLVQSTTFLALFAAALATRRAPAWHRRLMTVAMVIILQGALDRMAWLPSLPLPDFWGSGARLFALAAPLVAFDVVTLRRLHPATLVGLASIALFVALVSVGQASAAWREVLLGVARALSAV